MTVSIYRSKREYRKKIKYIDKDPLINKLFNQLLAVGQANKDQRFPMKVAIDGDRKVFPEFWSTFIPLQFGSKKFWGVNTVYEYIRQMRGEEEVSLIQGNSIAVLDLQDGDILEVHARGTTYFITYSANQRARTNQLKLERTERDTYPITISDDGQDGLLKLVTLRDGTRYAVKSAKEDNALMIREYTTLKELQDIPEVVRVKEFFKATGGNPAAFSLEYLEGYESLFSLVHTRMWHTMPYKWRLNVLKNIAIAYQKVNRKGYYHNDVQTRNIMVNRDGQIKLIDFVVGGESIVQGESTNDIAKFALILSRDLGTYLDTSNYNLIDSFEILLRTYSTGEPNLSAWEKIIKKITDADANVSGQYNLETLTSRFETALITLVREKIEHFFQSPQEQGEFYIRSARTFIIDSLVDHLEKDEVDIDLEVATYLSLIDGSVFDAAGISKNKMINAMTQMLSNSKGTLSKDVIEKEFSDYMIPVLESKFGYLGEPVNPPPLTHDQIKRAINIYLERDVTKKDMYQLFVAYNRLNPQSPVKYDFTYSARVNLLTLRDVFLTKATFNELLKALGDVGENPSLDTLKTAIDLAGVVSSESWKAAVASFNEQAGQAGTFIQQVREAIANVEKKERIADILSALTPFTDIWKTVDDLKRIIEEFEVNTKKTPATGNQDFSEIEGAEKIGEPRVFTFNAGEDSQSGIFSNRFDISDSIEQVIGYATVEKNIFRVSTNRNLTQAFSILVRDNLSQEPTPIIYLVPNEILDNAQGHFARVYKKYSIQEGDIYPIETANLILKVRVSDLEMSGTGNDRAITKATFTFQVYKKNEGGAVSRTPSSIR